MELVLMIEFGVGSDGEGVIIALLAVDVTEVLLAWLLETSSGLRGPVEAGEEDISLVIKSDTCRGRGLPLIEVVAQPLPVVGVDFRRSKASCVCLKMDAIRVDTLIPAATNCASIMSSPPPNPPNPPPP